MITPFELGVYLIVAFLFLPNALIALFGKIKRYRRRIKNKRSLKQLQGISKTILSI